MEPTSAINNNFLIRWAVTFLSPKMKRLLYLASLTGAVKGTTVPEIEVIHKLNEILQLSVKDDALKLPIYVSSALWSNKQVFKSDIDTLCTVCEDDATATISAQRLVKATPIWFRYNEEKMVKDILFLFTKGSCLFVQPALV